MSSVVVVGAGQAAASFAQRFRKLDPDTPLTIIGDEPVIPYQRPPLSKKYAVGEMSAEQLNLKSETWYTKQNIDLRTSTTVNAIDRKAKLVQLSDGSELPWTKLCLATGSSVRRLPQSVTGDFPGIHYLRSVADADAFATLLNTAKKVLIAGGGYIGLEVAAVCASKGMEVTVVEAADRILQRVACKETSDWFRTLHQSNGVTIKEGIGLSHFEGEKDGVTHAVLADDTVCEIDAAVVGIGIIPNADLAQACGLRVSDGIVVDQHCRTSDPTIYAAGDCAIAEYDGQPTRLESVPNAIDQATIAGENAATDGEVQYDAKPWFWSEQYDVKLQIAGLNRGYDQVVVRDGLVEGSCSHFYYRAGLLKAVDAMNDARIYMSCKRLLSAGKTVSPEQAADKSFDLKSLLN